MRVLDGIRSSCACTVLIFLATALNSCNGAPRDPIVPKNVLIVLLDATSAHHLHEWGYRRDPAPNLGKLAKRGMVFLNAHAQSANTVPSVWSFFTGRYPYIPGPGYTMHHPSDTDFMMADAFRAAGFKTGAVSESPWIISAHNWSKGFDDFKDVPALYDKGLEKWSRDPGATQRTINHAQEWIAAQGDARWFCYVHLERPHDPYDAPEPFNRRYGQQVREPGHPRAEDQIRIAALTNPASITPDDVDYMVDTYDANIRYVDSLFGRLMKWLDDTGLRENTLVIIMSDHGEAFWQHGVFGHNTTMYEEVSTVPLIIAAPKSAGFKRGSYSGLVELMDLMPTLTELFSLKPSTAYAGQSLLHALRGQPQSERAHIATHSAFDLHRFSYRLGNLKLIAQMDPDFREFRSVELYDLAADPREANNIAADTTRLEPLQAEALVHLNRVERRDASDDPQLEPISREQICALGYIECE